jgi:hypothetical protein
MYDQAGRVPAGLHPRPLWRWEPRDSNPHPAFGGLVKLHSAPFGRYRMEIFLPACSLNGGLTPNSVPTKRPNAEALGLFVGTV